ncbi:pleckstrin homology domain-containing family S member 1-like isoform X2 [Colossoma macropomum]|uniref:pleckstrin homology domain-containing family S member 1-like isoform X2 n=1 Tax=Colossoma macropomum TaxID=42526 RepID=UPI0018647C5C|nr:pleckstrin homology domain-containing family S member 1-like isoform X2 [Colossoma macropomum]
MSSNLRKISESHNSLFYDIPASNTEEVLSGYLYKSPPPSVLTKSMKSWKHRFFVLNKTDGHLHELKYFKDANKRDKSTGKIDLYQISLFFLNPEKHPTWEWIQKNFRCSSSCVLYMRVLDRDYFLIGKNSTDMEDWFNAIFAALKTQPHTQLNPERNRKIRSISEPSNFKTSNQDFAENKEQLLQNPSSPSVRHSAPESFNVQYSHYDYPRNFMMKTSPESEGEEEEEDDVKIEAKSETETDTDYMDMASVRKVVSEDYSDDDLTYQILLNGGDKDSENACQNCNDKSGSTGLNRRIPQLSETLSPEEKEICVSQEELKNNVIFSEEAGKPCVSDLKHVQSSGPFHEGDQIVAINDLLTDTLEEVQTFLKRLSKDQMEDSRGVKIQRLNP